MHSLIVATLAFLIGGCSIALTGQQAAGAGGTASTAASTRLQAGTGTIRAGGSFGAPAPAGSAGGQVSLSRGAAVALVLGLVIADFLHVLSSPVDAAMPQRSIADTCSCYGYTPAAAH
ncbi:MAG: hypothetical protein ACT4PS_13290 [Betaproteobacteria bacterium]